MAPASERAAGAILSLRAHGSPTQPSLLTRSSLPPQPVATPFPARLPPKIPAANSTHRHDRTPRTPLPPQQLLTSGSTPLSSRRRARQPRRRAPPSLSLQAPGCNRGAGEGGWEPGSRGAFWGRARVKRCLSNGAVRVWRKFGLRCGP